MEDLFVRRQVVEYNKIVAIVAATMRPENYESASKALKKLGSLMFPRDEKAEDEREGALRETLRIEGKKSYKVHKINLGERGK
jgi:hypothetical protein